MVRGRLRLLILAACGPAILLAAVETVMLAAALVGEDPRWAVRPLNVSEAAAARDAVEMVRLLEQGEDPDTRRPVRPRLLNNEEERLATPLEAAVHERRPELVLLLFEHGANPAPAEWLRLWCAAGALDYSEIVAALDRRAPPGVEVRCSGTETIW